jgi:hypothetical protein
MAMNAVQICIQPWSDDLDPPPLTLRSAGKRCGQPFALTTSSN